MAPTLKQLREMPEKEVIRLYDEQATHTVTGTDFYKEELNRRTSERQVPTITFLTWVIAVLTLVLVVLTLVLVFKHG